MKPIILIGPIPPPINGQSVAFQMLLDAIQHKQIPHKVINISSKIDSQKMNKFNRALEYIAILAKYLFHVCRPCSLVYLTIAQSQQGFMRDFIMIWTASLMRHQIVGHLHGGNYHTFYEQQSKSWQFLIRQTLLRFNKIAVLGNSLQSMFDFEKRLKPKICVIPNGVQSPVAPSQFIPKTLPPFNQKPISLLYLSNLVEFKGYLDVLDSIGILVNQYHLQIICYFCGEFLSKPRFDQAIQNAAHAERIFYEKVEQLNLNDYVKYEGIIDKKEKSNFLKNSHFLILPTKYEGQPISILEAMSYGSVVISTKCGSIPDMVLDHKTGILVPYQNPHAIADAIDSLTQTPEKYTKMSQSAYLHYQKHFTLDTHLSQMFKFLQIKSC